MTVIAVLAAGLVVAMVVYLAGGLRAASQAAGRRDELRHQLAARRERLLAQLNELDVEEGDRNVDPSVAADERLRLEAELAEVLRELDRLGAAAGEAGAETADRGSASGRLWYAGLVALLVFLPGAAVGLYWLHFTPPPEDPFELATPGGIGPQQILGMVARLEQRLAEQPDDPQGWARLGRSYAVLGRMEEAEQAYGKAWRLAPDNRQILEEYAWLLYNKDPAYTGEPVKGLYTRLHRLDPDNREALWFLGLAAYQQRDFRTALAHWERLLQRLPPGDPTAEHLRTVIGKARAEAKGTPPAERTVPRR